jgi:hypothetical protein
MKKGVRFASWISRFALPLELAAAGCGGSATTRVEALADSLQSVSGGTKIVCTSLTLQAGHIGSGQTVATLADRQLSGTKDVWSDYVEFSAGAIAICDYPLPASLAASSIQGLTLSLNYMGPQKSEMRWTWEALDHNTGSWVLVGDNAFAADWRWTADLMVLPTPVNRFVSAGSISIRYKAANRHDASDLDEMALYATTGGCTPSCTGMACGPDGCGGSCGTCAAGLTCDASGQCVASCVPSCTGKACGPDGCGGSCGSCATGSTCDASGQCVASCVPSCAGKACGPDGCGGSCGTCTTGSSCDATGQCVSQSPGAWWMPPEHLTWYWQLQGTVNLTLAEAAYDIDGFDNTATTVSTLHGQGKKVICYFSAGTAENWRPDYGQFPASTLGNGNGWPGEKWLDVRSPAIRPIMLARMQMCKDKGFDAIEPDNIDGYSNSTGFPLTAQDQITYNTWLADAAHSLGLAAFLKNDVDQLAALQPYFDGAINEQCAQYSECDGYSVFLSAGKPVLQAEYSGASFCASANSAGRMAALFSLNLDGSTFQPCW